VLCAFLIASQHKAKERYFNARLATVMQRYFNAALFRTVIN